MDNQEALRRQTDGLSDKSWLATFLLSTFLGLLGAHRFYTGRIASGAAQLVFGIFTLFIWNLVDWIMIVCGVFKDAKGRPVRYQPLVADSAAEGSSKSRFAALIFSSVLGIFGAHRFYAERIGSGIAQLFLGIFTLYIWNLIDWIMIVGGVFKDAYGKPIKHWRFDQ